MPQSTSSVLSSLFNFFLLLASVQQRTFAVLVPSEVRIGALYDGESPTDRTAVRLAVEFVNNRTDILPATRIRIVEGTVVMLANLDSVLTVCHQAEKGVATFIGPGSSSSVKTTQLVSAGLAIPQIAPIATDPMLDNPEKYRYLLRMSAPDTVQSRALVDLVNEFGWQQMSILVSRDDYGTHGLMEFKTLASQRGWLIRTVQQFQPKENPAQIDVLLQLKAIKTAGARIILLNCGGLLGMEVLRKASTMGMTGEGWVWIVTDGIASISIGETKVKSELSDEVPDDLVGVLGTRPVGSSGDLYTSFRQYWRAADPILYPGAGKMKIEARAAKFADAVLTFAYAFQQIIRDGFYRPETPLFCEGNVSWKWTNGPAMLEYLKKVDEPGISQRLRFTSARIPRDPLFDVVNLRKHGWHTVGRWDEARGLSMRTRNVTFMGMADPVPEDYRTDLRNRTLRVVTIVESPFMIMRDEDENGKVLHGNERFSGFCVDLLDWMSQEMGFRYNLYHVADNNWGAKDPSTGKWNGVVADVAYKKADMVVASITIRADREVVVDFTTPYVDVGLTFVMSKVGRKEISLFNFFGPLEKRLWLLIAITTVAVGVFLSIVNKLSPYSCRPVAITQPGQDNHEREPSLKKKEKEKEEDEEAEDDENDQTRITLGDWIWNSFCTLFQQGPEEYPKSAAGRFTAGVWWLVILILIATYTANLAAHLTIGRLQETVGSVEDLAKQTEIAYGTVLSSGPHSFFQQSTIETFQTMARYMATHDVMVATSEEGIERARRGNYAFVWDSGILDYVTKTPPCDLKTVGRLFSKTGYGFALQKNSPYTKEFTEKILWARESGKLEELFSKWTGGSECAREDAKLSTIVIGLDHMLGVFVLVYGAMAISLVVLSLEWIIVCVGDVDKKSAKKPQTMPEAFLGRFKSLKQKLFGDSDPLARFRLPRRRTPVPAKEEYECNTQATL
ncbi:glutamate receptor ionotropic, kainate 2-like isoform X1 [Branchiostoma lanceolatum]|uniref:glutamate receptor ionotropic, kainate 2-like isoform X1 n=1 Tax=Branchiostoma lanceolatum TaxID=7740 RepID=UPI0034542998